ncbi:MAG: Yip1 family protein [Acidimicrobiales bacterium]
MIPRLIGALKGDVATFEEVEHDESATIQAAIVVVIAAVLGGAGAAIFQGTQDDGSAGQGFIVGVLATLIAWLVWAAATHFVGSRWFGAQSSLGEMLRVIGFAHVVLWLTVIPIIGFFAGLWFLWVVFKAVRAGLDISTGKTAIVVAIGFVIRVIANVLPIL